MFKKDVEELKKVFTSKSIPVMCMRWVLYKIMFEKTGYQYIYKNRYCIYYCAAIYV